MQTLLKLVLLSFIAGLVFAVVGIDPITLWSDLGGTLARVWEFTGETARWAIKYVALGALVVIPIWVVFRILHSASEARSNR